MVNVVLRAIGEQNLGKLALSTLGEQFCYLFISTQKTKSNYTSERTIFLILERLTCGCKTYMATNGVRLVGAWQSPFVLRARIALNIKSVDYEFLEETFGSKSELLVKSNPVYKKIPVLIHNEKPICESLVVVQYIDEVGTSGPSILPSDPYDRAIARFWAAYIDDKLFPSLNGIQKAQGEEAKKAAVEQVFIGLAFLEDAFQKCSKGNNFFSGSDHIGYLDIALGCFLAWISVAEKMSNVKLIDEAKTPNLFNWAERFRSDPAVKDVIPSTERLIEFAKILIAKLRASPAN